VSDADIRDYSERPVFGDIGIGSFSFAFELYPSKQDRQAFQLEEVWRGLGPELRKALIGPFASYLDDVTTGKPGRNGRPLIFLAKPPETRLAVDVRRDPQWIYEAEGLSKRLHVDPGRLGHKLLVRDAFCAFRSGRLFYILSLALPRRSGQPIDEYFIIQMQRLAMDPNAAAGLSFLYRGAADATLIGFTRARLAELVAEPRNAPLSGLRRIVEDKGLLDRDEIEALRHAELESDDTAARSNPGGGAGHHGIVRLRGLCIGIVNEALMEAAQRACRKFGHGQPAEGEAQARRPGRVRELVRSLISREVEDEPPSLPLHNDGQGRALFALSGLAQGVADFGVQDPGELRDATCPANQAEGYVLFAHPAFLLEIARNWRAVVRCRHSVGTCPYLMLIWIAAIHADLLVAELERGIDDMVYQSERKKDFRAVALGDLRDALQGAHYPFAANGERLLRENLQQRLALVGNALMHQSSTLFRYPKEKGDLAAALEVMGTTARFERAQLLLEKVEDLVEDVIDQRRSYTEQLTNALLLTLALMGIIAVPKMVQEFDQAIGLTMNPLIPSAVLVAFLATVFLFTFLRRR
jgi:hypothetical protein